jgi:hypothetical protein
LGWKLVFLNAWKHRGNERKDCEKESEWSIYLLNMGAWYGVLGVSDSVYILHQFRAMYIAYRFLNFCLRFYMYRLSCQSLSAIHVLPNFHMLQVPSSSTYTSRFVYSQTFENKSSLPPNPPAGFVVVLCVVVVVVGAALLHPPKSSSCATCGAPHPGLFGAAVVVAAGWLGAEEPHTSLLPHASMFEKPPL